MPKIKGEENLFLCYSKRESINSLYLILMVRKDAPYPVDLFQCSVFLFHLFGEARRLVGAIADGPIGELGVDNAAIGLAVHAAPPLLGLGPGPLRRHAIEAETRRKQDGVELLDNPVPLAPELVRVVGGGDEDRVLDHLEDVRLAAAEEPPPVVHRHGRSLHGSDGGERARAPA